jgi:hypothetical protein
MRKSIVSDAEMRGFQDEEKVRLHLQSSSYTRAATRNCGYRVWMALGRKKSGRVLPFDSLAGYPIPDPHSGAGVTGFAFWENGGLKRRQNPPVSAAIFPETCVGL